MKTNNSIFKGILFLVGWTLSPFTWWNDAFVNIPISYALANIFFFMTHLNFGFLVLIIYWFTNILGIYFMWTSGKGIMATSKNRFSALIFIAITVALYSAIMIYIDRHGNLLPITKYVEKIRSVR